MSEYKLIASLCIVEALEIDADDEDKAFDSASDIFFRKYDKVYEAVETIGGLISTTISTDDGNNIARLDEPIDRR